MKLGKIKTELLAIDNDIPILHITFLESFPEEEMIQTFIQKIKREMPKNVRIIATKPSVKIKTYRPKVVTLKITDCNLQRKDLIEQISGLLRKRADTFNINLKNITVED